MQKRNRNVTLVVRRSPLGSRLGILSAGPLRLRCAIGRSGTTIFKREGDGATPVATMALLGAYVRPLRLAGVRLALPVRRTRSAMGWCDAPTHPAYNREVRLPFPESAETMERADRLYDLVLVLDWNITERRRHKGSAIFLHIAREGYRATEGCVAVSPADMRRLAPLLRNRARLTVCR